MVSVWELTKALAWVVVQVTALAVCPGMHACDFARTVLLRACRQACFEWCGSILLVDGTRVCLYCMVLRCCILLCSVTRRCLWWGLVLFCACGACDRACSTCVPAVPAGGRCQVDSKVDAVKCIPVWRSAAHVLCAGIWDAHCMLHMCCVRGGRRRAADVRCVAGLGAVCCIVWWLDILHDGLQHTACISP